MKPKLLYLSQGKPVAELQSRLNLLLPDKVPALQVDGIFGMKTLQRVQGFQTKFGLVPDGVVGPKTWAALEGTAPPPPGPKPTTPGPPIQHNIAWTPVTQGACLRCSAGMSPAFLSGLPAKQPATILDNKPYLNIPPFGMCQSFANPGVVAATQASQGVLTPIPCTPVSASAWSPAQPQQLVGPLNLPAIGQSSSMSCAFGGIVSVT